MIGLPNWGGEHVEIVPFGFDLVGNDDLVDAIREKANKVGIELSNYAILADLLKESDADYEHICTCYRGRECTLPTLPCPLKKYVADDYLCFGNHGKNLLVLLEYS